MGHELGSRERVLRAIEHREVDRIPCFFAAEEEVRERLMDALGLDSALAITRHFGADTIQVSIYSVFNALPDLSRVETVDDVEALAWPGAEALDVAAAARQLAEARETGLAVLGGVWSSVFTWARQNMGEAKFLLAMAEHPDLVARVVERETDFFIAANEALFSAAADSIDVFFFGSDFGTQRSLFISREHFRRLFKPSLTRLAQQAKGFGLRVMYHTCGAVSEIIPDLIECGIDVLDPVQVSAHDMGPKLLAERYKGKIAFHGGVSSQTTLPHGTPEQVRAEVTETIEALGPSGYIAGPDQSLIGDTPVANIVAMYEAIHDYRL
ncbi:MAG TPA: uroporphyrinogen decarboxylase family protein [Armatimonadota bacterium]|nr:uroporphyrinogen decarboxylase family protein [Armatimonadota bacterium]